MGNATLDPRRKRADAELDHRCRRAARCVFSVAVGDQLLDFFERRCGHTALSRAHTPPHSQGLSEAIRYAASCRAKCARTSSRRGGGQAFRRGASRSCTALSDRVCELLQHRRSTTDRCCQTRRLGVRPCIGRGGEKSFPFEATSRSPSAASWMLGWRGAHLLAALSTDGCGRSSSCVGSWECSGLRP